MFSNGNKRSQISKSNFNHDVCKQSERAPDKPWPESRQVMQTDKLNGMGYSLGLKATYENLRPRLEKPFILRSNLY